MTTFTFYLVSDCTDIISDINGRMVNKQKFKCISDTSEIRILENNGYFYIKKLDYLPYDVDSKDLLLIKNIKTKQFYWCEYNDVRIFEYTLDLLRSIDRRIYLLSEEVSGTVSEISSPFGDI